MSPAWFERRPAAPTYLHVTVHVQATARPLEQSDAIDVLLDTVAAFESTRDGWSYDGGERYLNGMSRGIVAFALDVEGVEAVGKLSQNRDVAEREALAARLEQSNASDDQLVAQFIRASLV